MVVEEEEEDIDDREENEEVEDEDGEEEDEEAPRPRPLLSLLLAPPQALLGSLPLVWSRMSSVAVRYFSSSVQGRLTGRFCWLEPPLALPFQGLSICTEKVKAKLSLYPTKKTNLGKSQIKPDKDGAQTSLSTVVALGCNGGSAVRPSS